MQRTVHSIRPQDSLAEAARVMWEKDCGFLPVIDPVSECILGVLTDRDACMGALLRGKKLDEITVEQTMQTRVMTCHENDDLDRILSIMRDKQIRRMPVISDAGHVLGVVSMNDVTRHAVKSGAIENFKDMVLKTIAGICKPRAEMAKEESALPTAERTKSVKTGAESGTGV
jgi:predicted transcriptional regulator